VRRKEMEERRLKLKISGIYTLVDPSSYIHFGLFTMRLEMEKKKIILYIINLVIKNPVICMKLSSDFMDLLMKFDNLIIPIIRLGRRRWPTEPVPLKRSFNAIIYRPFLVKKS
jgi:hypothetical protein